MGKIEFYTVQFMKNLYAFPVNFLWIGNFMHHNTKHVIDNITLFVSKLSSNST